MRRVQTSRRPKGETKSNRYTLQTEIAATPTKQTVGTRVNRYKNQPFTSSVGLPPRSLPAIGLGGPARPGDRATQGFKVVSCHSSRVTSAPPLGAPKRLTRRGSLRGAGHLIPHASPQRTPPVGNFM